MTAPVDSRAYADLALAVYLEPLVEDRHVLLLGDARGALAERLEQVALSLDIIDPAAREPSRGPVPELPFDDAAFDVVLACDVAALPDPRPDAIRELRRVLADDGVIALCAPPSPRKRRRSGPPDEMLERLLAPQFRYVRTFVQKPVAGHTLGLSADAESEEFAIDSSLVRGERAEALRHFALASDVRFRIDSRLWVEVPADKAGAEAGVSFAALQKLEDEARAAAQREADAVRALDAERKRRAEAEHKAERAAALERRLRDAEADYDDAVARLRFLEGELAEREAELDLEKKKREALEQELSHEKAQVLSVDARMREAEADREAARADAEARVKELEEVEARLVERAQEIQALKRELKEKETIARDLLEELRRLEQQRTSDVEHDARVAELEAERDRAVERALEAEVAREAALMRVDELRAQLPDSAERSARPALDPEVEGTLYGLKLRVKELERELAEAKQPVIVKPFVATESALPPPPEAAELLMLRGRVLGLEQRLEEAEKTTRDAEERARELESRARDAEERARELESGVREAEERTRELERRMREAEARAREAQERAREAEERLMNVPTPATVLVDRALEHAGRGERTGLALRLKETEEALQTMRAALARARDKANEAAFVAAEREALRAQLEEAVEKERKTRAEFEKALREEREASARKVASLEARVDELERLAEDLRHELDEADRVAEAHAEDASRIEALEYELEAVRRRLDAAEDDLRATEDALRVARAEAEQAALEASARVELAQRRESEARQERDAARSALEEARAMLQQLAAGKNAAEQAPAEEQKSE